MGFTQVACNSTDRTTATNTEASGTSDQAYNDYKSYVTTYESDVNGGWDSTETDWDSRMTRDRQRYDSLEYAVSGFESTLDENQKAEYAEYRSRYQNAWQQREGQYSAWMNNNQSTSASSTNRSAGMSSEVDMSSMNTEKIPSYTARDIREAYESFVSHVESNKSNYSNDDWKTVEMYWNKLDDRKNAIQSELSDKDKWEIAKAKTKYIAMKNASKAGNTASNVGSSLKETGKDVSNSKVGENVKDAGQAVGSGAKKAGKAVGNTVKKGANKVEDAFDGDDN